VVETDVRTGGWSTVTVGDLYLDQSQKGDVNSVDLNTLHFTIRDGLVKIAGFELDVEGTGQAVVLDDHPAQTNAALLPAGKAP
jgi:hypothetical protein